MNMSKLSKLMSFILRHNPEKFGVKLDNKGFINMESLLVAIKKRVPKATLEDVKEVVFSSPKKRFEIVDSKIRATYGHSLNIEIDLPEVIPPENLFHGTERNKVLIILKEGLKPKARRYVHLSKSEREAYLVGVRRDPRPAILRIYAQKAYKNGIKFYSCGDVFLTPSVPGQFIETI